MAVIIKKRGKYLEGHGYATGLGYSFTWTADPEKARRFADDEDHMFHLNLTKGSALLVSNTKRELRALGRKALQAKA